jgi:predicted transposase YdaD
MPRIVKAMMQRVDPAATSSDAKEFWGTTALLAGLRFPWESVKRWFQGVAAMQESSVYQGLLQEGRIEGRAEGLAEGRVGEARRIVLRLGGKRFGVPDAESRTKLESMSDVEQLEQLAERVHEVASWAELLATS